MIQRLGWLCFMGLSACQPTKPLAPPPFALVGPGPLATDSAVPTTTSSPLPPVPASEDLATEVGVEAPIVFEAAAQDGSWTLVCQPRSDTDGNGRLEVSVTPLGALGGDALTRSLWLAPRTEIPIDDVLVRSDDDSRVLVVRDQRLFIAQRGALTELSLPGADLRFEPDARSGHRTLALRGSLLHFVRVEKAQSQLWVRDLESGAERLEYAGAEPIVRFDVDPTGALVVLRVAGVDANGNGRFDWPYVPRSEPRPCAGPIPTLRARLPAADPLGAVVLDRRTATLRRVDDLVLPFGTALIRRGGDGTLVLDTGGVTRVLADKNCAGRVIWADPARDQLLLGCSSPKKPGRLLVELVQGGTRVPLDIDVASLGVDEPLGEARRLLALYPGADTVLYDLEHRQLYRLRPGDAVIQSAGPRALVRRGRSLYVFDVETAREQALPGEIDPYGGVLVRGHLAYVSPLLVDVATGRVLGSVPGPGLALSAFGAVLAPTSPASARSLAAGPLRWLVLGRPSNEED